MEHLPSTTYNTFSTPNWFIKARTRKGRSANNDFKNFIKKKKKKKSPDGRAHKTDEAEILYEKIRMLEKENQCLKNKIKNQQVVIEMLITNDKCAD